MTVAELIAQLQKLPPDTGVVIPDAHHAAAEISSVELRDVPGGIEGGRIVHTRRVVIA
ncbi:hypothetical protein H7J07_04815 [Mycobacterium koreense]|uniref:hypothetical protein n=1 Tax=Mycolicibacillus koreensis TaxID=1069220 RepID=UPI00138CA350|nr:hypothetical protein [Mycolicibacillus koreensis]MCV7247579.1 hypothetical protein [Mycolicibacillus koreensis]BBY53957.1 hypothetical protein MKOR_12080 [Mycolicibacillus koreensis]